MREIKFRAYRKDKKRFSYYVMQSDSNKYRKGGWFYFDENGTSIIDESIDENIEKNEFTGLQDKNGNDIYEGDIVRQGQYIKWFYNLNYDGGGAKHPGFYFNKTFSIEDDGELSYHCDLNDCEIIGNIHENPELMR